MSPRSGEEAARAGGARRLVRGVRALILLAVAASASSCSDAEGPTARVPDGPTYYGYEVVNIYPHDPGAFTQGLTYRDGFLYEGTGLFGASSLRRVELETGRVLQQYNLPSEYFGEGIAVWGDEIFQLSWLSHVGFIYDRATFAPERQFSYATEGWGLSHNKDRFVMSDGSSTLYFLDAATLEEVRRVQVHDGDEPVTRLNELEYVAGQIYANVYGTDLVALISPAEGRVAGWLELAGLPAVGGFKPGPGEVANGIAYDADGGRLFVTGKRWPKLFEIRLVPEG